jgi:hypothetical protein
MAIYISDNPADWRTDFTREELSSRMRELGLPEPLVKIAMGGAPGALMYRCESPCLNGIWPLQEDYVPVWTCNGTSAVGYEPSTGHFHSQDIEDILEVHPDVYESYHHLSAWIVRQLIEAGRSDVDVEAAANFLEFQDVERLKSADTLESFLEQSDDGQ